MYFPIKILDLKTKIRETILVFNKKLLYKLDTGNSTMISLQIKILFVGKLTCIKFYILHCSPRILLCE